jgi:D-amino-acid dehydrogenase
MMPDMMPRVCQGSKPNIFYNTGHGHLGWTLGAITAVKLSELVSLWQKQTATASSRRLLTKPAQIASARINS